MRFSLVSALLCLAAAATAQDVVTITATEAVTRESAGTAKPGRFELTRNGSTGDLVVLFDLEGTAVLGSSRDYRVGSNVSQFSVKHIDVIDGGAYNGIAGVTIAAPPSGITATATAIMGINAGLVVDDGGLYTAQPTISVAAPIGGTVANIIPVMEYETIAPPVSTGAGAIDNGIYPGLAGSTPVSGDGVAAIGVITVSGNMATLSITDEGSGYAIGELVNFTAIDTFNRSVTVTGVAAHRVRALQVLSSGLGYTSVLTNVVPVRGGSDSVASSVGNDASINFDLTVAGFTVTNGGSGYTSTPAVTLSGGGNAIVDVVSANVTIPNGERTAEVRIIPVSDLLIEQAESVMATIISSGSNYIVGPDFSSTVVIQDDDMTLGWSVIDESAEEAFAGGRPEESTYAMRFARTEAGVVGDPRSFDRYVRFQIGGGSATLGNDEDYVYTYMHRHAGQPTGMTMQELRTTNFDFTVGWYVNGSADENSTSIPYKSSIYGVLSVGDLIQFGEDNLNLYTIIAMNASTLWIDRPLVEAVEDEDLIRNNIAGLITEDGGSQGNNVRSIQHFLSDVPEIDFLFSGDDGIDITYTPIFDADAEASEVVRSTIWASNDYLLTDPQVMDSIIGDDDLLVDITWTANAARPTVVEEPGTTGSATISLSAPAPRDIPISYRVQGTAVGGTDYDALTGTITVPEGEDSIVIPIVPRASAAGLRTVILTLIDSLDYELVGSPTGDLNPSATVNIIDQIGTVSVAASDAVAGESDSTLPANANPGRFTVSILRLPGQTGPVSVVYTVSGSAIAGSDYTALPGNVTIPDGLDSVNITVTVLDDRDVESNEDITINVESAAGYSVDNLNSTATVQIVDDEPRVQVAITGLLAEPATNAVATFSYPTTALNRSILVKYTVSGTATMGSDFAGLGTGTANISAGSNTTSIPITVLNDFVAEGPESVVITIVEDGAYGLDSSAATASVTITDDEPYLAMFTFADGAGNGEEPGTPARVAVALVDSSGNQVTTPLTTDVSFTFSVNVTDVEGIATFGSDFTLPGAIPTGAGTILAGQTFATVSIPVLDDSEPEGDEIGGVFLEPSTSYGLVDDQTVATFLILDNEATVEIASTSNASEPSTAGSVIVRNRGGVLSAPLVVRYSVSGSARSGVDYVGLSGSVTIPAGSSQASIAINPIDNSREDGTRTVVVSLRSSPNYFVADPGSGIVGIIDNDGPGSPSPDDGDRGGGGSSCGAGSGIALLLGFASLAFLSQRRRRGDR